MIIFMSAHIIGLSTLAVCAPSEKFLNMGGPLAMGLGVVFMSSLGKLKAWYNKFEKFTVF